MSNNWQWPSGRVVRLNRLSCFNKSKAYQTRTLRTFRQSYEQLGLGTIRRWRYKILKSIWLHTSEKMSRASRCLKTAVVQQKMMDVSSTDHQCHHQSSFAISSQFLKSTSTRRRHLLRWPAAASCRRKERLEKVYLRRATTILFLQFHWASTDAAGESSRDANNVILTPCHQQMNAARTGYHHASVDSINRT